MKTLAAVLRAVTDKRPYTTSLPLSLEEVELSAPRPGELLLKMMAAGVCHSDLSVVDGARIRPLPMALGHEAVGTVLEVGPGVRDVAVGDHVVCSFVPSCGSAPSAREAARRCVCPAPRPMAVGTCSTARRC